jgi:hypothetical protein
VPRAPAPIRPARKKGRRKGEQPSIPQPTRLERRAGIALEELLADLLRVQCKQQEEEQKGIREIEMASNSIKTLSTARKITNTYDLAF